MNDKDRVRVTCCECAAANMTAVVCIKRRAKAGLGWRCRSCAMRERAARKAIFPPHVKDRAVQLRTRGYGPKEIVQHLRDEGYRVGQSTISVWTATTRRAA